MPFLGRKVTPYKGQDYDAIKKDLLKTGSLFEDTLFAAKAESLSFKQPPKGVEWKRPGELAEKPQLFVGGAGAEDFSQGELGNCWFVAACASIANKPEIWKKVVPDYEEQDFGSKYAGIFHFHFFHFGEWIDVVVDDLLPTRNGKLIYVRSKDENEFWGALLEKAYAKLFGDYESLESGKARDALEDMMGGVGEGVVLKEIVKDAKQREQFWKDLEEAFENNSLISASVVATSKNEVEEKLSNGLVKGHAYSVTDVREVPLGSGLQAFFKGQKLHMVRLRNPWGGKEWNGAWSDGSKEWDRVSEDERKEMGITFRDDGEFWMSYNDFLSIFTHVDLCHTINTSFFSFKKTWKEYIFKSQWKKPNLCGGCGNHDSFIHNPQFAFQINEKEETVLISLAQEDKRINKEGGAENFTIGFSILKTDLNREYRMHDLLEKVEVSNYINSRSVLKRLKLKRGAYMIIPSTFDPGFEGKLLLRLYCGKEINAKELIEDGPSSTGGCCGPKYKSATTIKVIKAQGLEKQDISGGADPYVKIKCEGHEYRTTVIDNERNPEWNERVCFYRKKPFSDITIEVWNENVIKDEHMGEVIILGPSNSAKKGGVLQLPLVGQGSKKGQFMPGKLFVEIKQFSDLNEC